MAACDGCVFEPSKIVGCRDGVLELYEDKIEEIFNCSIFKNNTLLSLPFALISIIGPKYSGKTLLTNILIQYLKDFENGGWLEDFISQAKNSETRFFGFDMESKIGVNRDSSESAPSGIYLWPEPSLVKLSEKLVAIWVLHISIVENEKKENIEALENFLVVTSSQVGEILYGENQPWANRLETTAEAISGFANTGASFAQKILPIFRGNLSKARRSCAFGMQSYQFMKAVGIEDFQKPVVNPNGVVIGINLQKYAGKIKQAIQKLVGDGESLIERTSLQDHFKSCLQLIDASKRISNSHGSHEDTKIKCKTSIELHASANNVPDAASTQAIREGLMNGDLIAASKDKNKIQSTTNGNCSEAKTKADTTSVGKDSNKDITKHNDMERIIENALLCCKNEWAEKMKPLALETSIDKINNGINIVFQDMNTKLLENVLQLPENNLGKLWKSFNAFAKEYVQIVKEGQEKFQNELKRLSSATSNKELEENLIEILQNILQDAPTDNSFNIRLMLEAVCNLEKLKFLNNVDNQRKQAISALTEHAVRFYTENCIPILEKDVHSPAQLKKLHRNIKAKLHDTMKRSIPSFEEAITQFPSTIEEMNITLDRVFNLCCIKNLAKIKEIREHITKAIRASNTDFTGCVENLLDKYEESPKLLNANYEKLEKTAKRKLEESIIKIRSTEPTALHLKSFQFYMDDYWLPIKEDLKLGANQPQKQSTHSANEKNKQIESSRSTPQILQNDTSSQIKLFSTKPHQNNPLLPEPELENKEGKYQTRSKDAKRVPTAVAIHMQYSCVRVTTANASKQNSKCEVIPFEVGMTRKGKLVCGNDIKRDQIDSNLLWNCMACITNDEWMFTIAIGNDKHEISRECVVGFILKHIKTHVQDDIFDHPVETAVIALPFWFSSAQRLFVKGAAKVAGFNEVYLVNETSATAYACVTSSDRFKSAENLIILSENSGKVDASVYQYHSKEKVLRMVGHSGNYCLPDPHASVGKISWLMEKGRDLASNLLDTLLFKSLFSLKSTKTNKELEQLKSVLSEAIKNASENNSNVVKRNMKRTWEIFKFTEPNSKLRSALFDISMENSEQLCYMKEDDAAVVGAAMLSENPSLISNTFRSLLGFDICTTSPHDLLKCKAVETPAEIDIKVHFTKLGQEILVQQVMGEKISSNTQIAGTMKTNKFIHPTFMRGKFKVSEEKILEFLPKSSSKDLNWYPCGALADEQIGMARSLIDFFGTNQA